MAAGGSAADAATPRLAPAPADAAGPAGPAPGLGPGERTPDGQPRLHRLPRDGVVGGVAAGLAEHLGVPVLWVRLSFALLAVPAGAGVLAYALLWIFAPPRVAPARAAGPTGPPPVARRQALGIAALGLALMIAAAAVGLGQVLGWVLGPLGLAAVGAAFIWREADETRRQRWRRSARGLVLPRAASWRLMVGVALVIGGLLVFALGRLDLLALRSALLSVLLTLVGVALITVPWWLRLLRDLGAERSARIRAADRAEIAAHLHDSVLQTLALIQRQAGDGREVARLARGQERELRAWLYGPGGYAAGRDAAADAPGDLGSGSFAIALRAAAGEVEDIYAVTLEPVVVGDADIDGALAALLAAAREAMVNAAKHAGVTGFSVYAEVAADQAAVFVRDRGRGFDTGHVDPDRHGLAESVRGRMLRHGGRAVVRSAPGQGTEVEMTMPRSGPRVPRDPGPGHAASSDRGAAHAASSAPGAGSAA